MRAQSFLRLSPFLLAPTSLIAALILGHLTMSQPASDDSPLHIFTTFRLDDTLPANAANSSACRGRHSDVYLLPYHYDRLKNAAAALTGFEESQLLSSLEEFESHIHNAVKDDNSDAEQQRQDVRRGKVSLWRDGRFEVSLVVAPQSCPLLFPQSFNEHPEPMWTVVLDVESTDFSIYNTYKTSNRAHYDRARKDAQLSPSSTTEVLLYAGNNGIVMDGTITTPYFYRDNGWVTPNNVGLHSVTKNFALDRGLCSKASRDITKDSLRPGEVVWLSNAFRGFFPATFIFR